MSGQAGDSSHPGNNIAEEIDNFCFFRKLLRDMIVQTEKSSFVHLDDDECVFWLKSFIIDLGNALETIDSIAIELKRLEGKE